MRFLFFSSFLFVLLIRADREPHHIVERRQMLHMPEMGTYVPVRV